MMSNKCGQTIKTFIAKNWPNFSQWKTFSLDDALLLEPSRETFFKFFSTENLHLMEFCNLAVAATVPCHAMLAAYATDHCKIVLTVFYAGGKFRILAALAGSVIVRLTVYLWLIVADNTHLLREGMYHCLICLFCFGCFADVELET